MTIRIGNPRVTINTTFTTSSSDLSNAVDLGGYRVAALVFPTSWTASVVTFQGALASTTETFKYMQDSAGAILTVTGGDGIVATLGTTLSLALGSCRYIKVRSGDATTGVSQTTERTVVLSLTPDRI